MSSKDVRRRKRRNWSIECLEDRRVMAVDALGQLLDGPTTHVIDEPIVHPGALDVAPSARPGWDAALPAQPGGLTEPAPALGQPAQRDADFWLDPAAERDFDALLGDIEQNLASAHSVTGLTQVRNTYGFIGTGQTVAIIDSGIAYDHYALGGGFGPAYRVVGGWDFTENDADPYDDAPEGAHGTHVAGIVGCDRAGTVDDGVAPGVDLVGLRVFNDAGEGYFSWMESALQWVHQYRNAFENPITAVNLSIGSSWNADSVPSWSTIEDELAQLKADGIFISVSAGNSFTSYNTPGLSYPAASPNVVPVMSIDDSGSLSYFSQRHTRAIAAPGRFIVSTVPDYIGNHNGVTDDFASFSGTSMASPYIAGSSVLVREAMQFVGYTNITQDTLYNHLMATADSFFDSATGQSYKRLNLASAFSALMPADDYGSTTADAYSMGTLSGTSQISGLIGTLSDADYFRFTAAAGGTVTFTANVTHSLAPVWTGSGTTSGPNGSTFTIQVAAGQSYTVGLSTSGGIGYYDLSARLDAVGPPSVPTSFQLAVVSPYQVDLSWSAAAGATFYNVLHWTADAGTNVVATVDANTTSYAVTGLTPATRHWFRIQAGNSAGLSNTEYKLAETSSIPVTAPTSFQVTVLSSTQVALNWSGATGATFYRVLHWTEQTSTVVVTTTAANVSSYTVTNLAPGTRHWFRVQAGNSSSLADTDFKLGQTPAIPITAPDSFQVSVLSATSVALNWSGGTGATFYRVVHWTEQAGTNIVATLDASATSYMVTNVTPGGRHWFRIQAGNASGVANTEFKLAEMPTTLSIAATASELGIPSLEFFVDTGTQALRDGSDVLHRTRGSNVGSRATIDLTNHRRPLLTAVRYAAGDLPATVQSDLENRLQALHELANQARFDSLFEDGTSEELLSILAQSALSTKWDEHAGSNKVARAWQTV